MDYPERETAKLYPRFMSALEMCIDLARGIKQEGIFLQDIDGNTVNLVVSKAKNTDLSNGHAFRIEIGVNTPDNHTNMGLLEELAEAASSLTIQDRQTLPHLKRMRFTPPSELVFKDGFTWAVCFYTGEIIYKTRRKKK